MCSPHTGFPRVAGKYVHCHVSLFHLPTSEHAERWPGESLKSLHFYKMERQKWLAEKKIYIFVIFYPLEIFNWCIFCIVWFVYFSVWDCNMYILSEIYFSLYFIILDQYLLILFVNINIFYSSLEVFMISALMSTLYSDSKILISLRNKNENAIIVDTLFQTWISLLLWKSMVLINCSFVFNRRKKHRFVTSE